MHELGVGRSKGTLILTRERTVCPALKQLVGGGDRDISLELELGDVVGRSGESASE